MKWLATIFIFARAFINAIYLHIDDWLLHVFVFYRHLNVDYLPYNLCRTMRPEDLDMSLACTQSKVSLTDYQFAQLCTSSPYRLCKKKSELI